MKKVISIRSDKAIDFKVFEDIVDLLRTKDSWRSLLSPCSIESRFQKAKAKILNIQQNDRARYMPKDFFNEFMWVDGTSFLQEAHLVYSIKDRVKAYLNAYVLLSLNKDDKGNEYSEALTSLLKIYWHVQGPAADQVREAIEEIFEEDNKTGHFLLVHRDGDEDKTAKKLKAAEVKVLKEIIFKAYKAGNYQKIMDTIKKLDGGNVPSYAKDPITNEPRLQSEPGDKFPCLKIAIPTSMIEPPFYVDYHGNDQNIANWFLEKAHMGKPLTRYSKCDELAYENLGKWRYEIQKRQKEMYEAILKSDPNDTRFHAFYAENYEKILFNIANRNDNGKSLENLFLSFTENDPHSEANKKYNEALTSKTDLVVNLIKGIDQTQSKDEYVKKFQTKLKEAIHGQSVMGSGLFDSALEAYFTANKFPILPESYKIFKENGMRLVEMGIFDKLLMDYNETKPTSLDPKEQEKEKIANLKKSFSDLIKNGKLADMLNLLRAKANASIPDDKSNFKDVTTSRDAFPQIWNYGSESRKAFAKSFIKL
ncbi:MAG: hypothetical protein WC860_01430, partial [Candidatus Margulisiibacteriota bacterium]